MELDIAPPTRSGFVRLPVELSGKERKSLKRIIGGEVEALAYLTVRVKVKREAEPGVPEQAPVADRANLHPKSALEKVS